MLNDNIYSIRETREQLSRLVELAYLTGGQFLVTKFGQPRAAIVPVPKDWLIKPKSILDFEGFLGKGGETGTELVNRIRRNKREKTYVVRLRKR
ncbi:hypothetical protein COX09_01910 [Candidatus Beckwithbacteria bacterium CG23_combo_of_CG06-09_8_20_14_all_47_9]|uniref:Antitoxin n=2 Tax=Candidatus Beckwithiibacteriota TaxID=1752726 RepID=A0A2H0B3Z7_9BACT|nr:MAG: hypothetical protein COX09_01910 [Candidatus Beckwithbacteria bacterium CG23_combo_of_CG06-09_8_20_14_all_47_9]PJC66280.1 MAG: hypothetical protein CO018_02785 [Candidatus Beckwithbacteria bacterium CG_4_9_14_0_2_um_filter_47_11]